MEREKLLRYLDKHYSSKREMLSRIPLGIHPDALWQEILNNRRAKSTVLPLYGTRGAPYWYCTTEKMVSASEKIVETLLETEAEFDPYDGPSTISNLEEVFYTSYVEGSQISMRDAMDFLAGERPPRDIEEQLIANNRAAGGYAAQHLGKTINEPLLGELAAILTDGMDSGGSEYRATEEVDFIPTDGGTYAFPLPHLIPDRVRDLCAYLASPTVHPLIKAAVAQGYILTLRPFPEGNDRLGRILSSMILHRCGYTFLNEVSLSALIARKSYAYYEAIGNILRDENEGDFTYFLEYFLELLARALDERHYRLHQREEQAKQEEIRLARSALEASVPQSSEEPIAQSVEPEPPVSDFFEPTEEPSVENGDDSVGRARLKDELYRTAESKGSLTQCCANLLLTYLNEGTTTFTVNDIAMGCSVDQEQAANLITHFRQKGLIESSESKLMRKSMYRLSTKFLPLTKKDYAAEIIEAAKEFLLSKHSSRDKRIGKMLLACLPKGIVSASDYAKHGGQAKLAHDMRLPELMGLVERLSDEDYRICRQIRADAQHLSEEHKDILTKLYQRFGHESFTREMVMDALNITRTAAWITLHELTVLHFLDCVGKPPYHYRILVDQGDNAEVFANATYSPLTQTSIDDQEAPPPRDPSCSEAFFEQLRILADSKISQRDRRLADSLQRCMEKGVLLPEDYDAWGYSINMWSEDTALALQLGLISKQADGGYLLNRGFSPKSPTLLQRQKETVSAIYEAFGEREFSKKMAADALNYSRSYAADSLHKLVLLRVVEQKSTEAGYQYQLLVNPKENPEFFVA